MFSLCLLRARVLGASPEDVGYEMFVSDLGSPGVLGPPGSPILSPLSSGCHPPVVPPPFLHQLENPGTRLFSEEGVWVVPPPWELAVVRSCYQLMGGSISAAQNIRPAAPPRIHHILVLSCHRRLHAQAWQPRDTQGTGSGVFLKPSLSHREEQTLTITTVRACGVLF